MIALVQRVSQASVDIDGARHASIGQGLLVLVCAEPGDEASNVSRLAQKTAKLRIFSDEMGRMNKSVLHIGGEVLVVSQFTLGRDTRSGHRPSFSRAAGPAEGEAGYLAYVQALRDQGLAVQTGVFGANMQVGLINDGPATFWLTL